MLLLMFVYTVIIIFFPMCANIITNDFFNIYMCLFIYTKGRFSSGLGALAMK